MRRVWRRRFKGQIVALPDVLALGEARLARERQDRLRRVVVEVVELAEALVGARVRVERHDCGHAEGQEERVDGVPVR